MLRSRRRGEVVGGREAVIAVVGLMLEGPPSKFTKTTTARGNWGGGVLDVSACCYGGGVSEERRVWREN